jgi:hypothetical protein
VSARAVPLPLVAATAAMAALTLLPWIIGPTVPAIPAPAARDTLPQLAALPPFADFGAIAARPLFSPTRRPDAAQAATGIAARYRLLGIAIAANARHALLAPVNGGAALELAEGDSIDGWTLRKIADDRIVLSSPTLGDATLALAPPASTPPPRQHP